MKALLLPLLCSVSLAALAQAPQPPQEGMPPAQEGIYQHHRMGPPQEAFTACTGKTVDAACSFQSRRGDALTGKCVTHRPRDDKQESAEKSSASSSNALACRPNRGQRGPQGDGMPGKSPSEGGPQASGAMDGQNKKPMGPPQEALTACTGKADGAACSFQSRRGDNLTGTCTTHRPRWDKQGSAEQTTSSSTNPLACRPDRGQRGPQDDGMPGKSQPGSGKSTN